MRSYIVGSVAFDRLMAFSGQFKDYILPEKIHNLNVSFMVDSLIERRGGTATNIAYSMAIMQEAPHIIASVGHDFTLCASLLQGMGLPLDGIQIISEMHTASCSIMTDTDKNQIASFYPGAASQSTSYGFPNLDAAMDWGIISPTNPDDMRNFPKIFREKGVPYMYDPGQQIPALSADDLLDGIQGSYALVSNDYELEMICKKTQRTPAEIRALTKHLITTQGGQGVRITSEEITQIEACKGISVIEPTGAGDAFRAGLLKGLMHGVNLIDSARLGVIVAAFSIEHDGPQEHAFTYEIFSKRYEATFAAKPSVSW